MQVIAAGSPAQVAAAVAAAEPLREQLQERGVLVVPLPIFPGDQAVSGGSENGAESSESSSSSNSSDSKNNLRWGFPCPLPAGYAELAQLFL